jgi:L-seryl-tRNA(Ser) seleniumtransferase
VVAHTSNYRVQGFTAEVEIEALARMAKQHSIPILHDLGGGVITDLQEWGLPYEPLVQDSLTAGVQVVTFSGDKVLGGPQAGIIAGEKEWIRRIHANPIMRAVRCDKLVFSAMEATLKLFLNPDQLLQNNKALQFLTDSVEIVKQKAQTVFDSLENRTGVTIEPCFSQTGSGALPLEKIDSFGLFIQHSDLENLHKRLRLGDPAVMGHIQNNKLILDMRTVDETQLLSLIERLNELLPMI